MNRRQMISLCFAFLCASFAFGAKAQEVLPKLCPCDALGPPTAEFVQFINDSICGPTANEQAPPGGGGGDPCQNVFDCNSCGACCVYRLDQDMQWCNDWLCWAGPFLGWCLTTAQENYNACYADCTAYYCS
jgi:hypothetical protein